MPKLALSPATDLRTSLVRWLHGVAHFVHPVGTLPAALIQHMSNRFVPPPGYGVRSTERRKCCFTDPTDPTRVFATGQGQEQRVSLACPGPTVTFSELISGLGYELDPDAKLPNMRLRPVLSEDADVPIASCFPLKFFISGGGEAYTADSCENTRAL